MSEDYSQPSFFKFSQVSIELAHHAAREFEKQSGARVLDLFAGSGIVGLEFLSHYQRRVEKMFFVELQKNFYRFLEKNISNFAKNTSCEIIISDFMSTHFSEKFDLILANPPYYEKDMGRSSADYRRDLCMRMHDFQINHFFSFLEENLSETGKVYFSYLSDRKNMIPQKFQCVEYPLHYGESIYELALLS